MTEPLKKYFDQFRFLYVLVYKKNQLINIYFSFISVSTTVRFIPTQPPTWIQVLEETALYPKSWSQSWLNEWIKATGLKLEPKVPRFSTLMKNSRISEQNIIKFSEWRELERKRMRDIRKEVAMITYLCWEIKSVWHLKKKVTTNSKIISVFFRETFLSFYTFIWISYLFVNLIFLSVVSRTVSLKNLSALRYPLIFVIKVKMLDYLLENQQFLVEFIPKSQLSW